MRPLPKNQLDPKVKNVWRISDALWLTVVYAACSVTFFIIALVVGMDRGCGHDGGMACRACRDGWHSASYSTYTLAL